MSNLERLEESLIKLRSLKNAIEHYPVEYTLYDLVTSLKPRGGKVYRDTLQKLRELSESTECLLRECSLIMNSMEALDKKEYSHVGHDLLYIYVVSYLSRLRFRVALNKLPVLQCDLDYLECLLDSYIKPHERLLETKLK